MVKENHDDSSESSDEDFCPDKNLAEDSEEVSSDEENEKDEVSGEEEEEEEDTTKKKDVKKVKKSAKCSTRDIEKNNSSRRSTRQTDADDRKNSREKDTLDDSDEDMNDKSRTDALWADFLSDVKPTEKIIEKDIPSTSSTKTTPKSNSLDIDAGNSSKSDKKISKDKDTSNLSVENNLKTVTVEEIVNFAGEEVRVQKTVNADSVKENKTSLPAKATPRGFGIGVKRPGSSPGGGGLGGILNQIGKKKKLSVLEKTKLDWNSYKEDQGLDEELKTYNKGKDGYLERQDFLQRTDLRQFEIEKNLRQSSRRTQ